MSRLKEIIQSGRAPGFNLKQADPTNADIAAPRALRQMEEQMGTSKLQRELGMSARKLKQIWDIK